MSLVVSVRQREKTGKEENRVFPPFLSHVGCCSSWCLHVPTRECARRWCSASSLGKPSLSETSPTWSLRMIRSVVYCSLHEVLSLSSLQILVVGQFGAHLVPPHRGWCSCRQGTPGLGLPSNMPSSSSRSAVNHVVSPVIFSLFGRWKGGRKLHARVLSLMKRSLNIAFGDVMRESILGSH